MRSYSSLLVLETLFDSLTTSDTTLCSVAHQLFHPRCNVVEEQCQTQLGEVIDVNFEIEGRVELATGLRISRQRISQLLGQGIYKVRTRTLSTCISKGGVCAACYAASRPLVAEPEVGSVVVVEPIFDKGAEVIGPVLPGTTIKLGVGRDMYDTAIVFIGGQLRDPGSYSISGTEMVFNSPLPPGTNVVVWYQSLTRVPFMLWLANTYSGSLLGVKSLPGPLLPIRSLLLSEILADAPLNLLLEQSKEIAGIPENMLRFAEATEDILERTLFLISLRILYGQQMDASDTGSNICYSCIRDISPPVEVVSLVISSNSVTIGTGATTVITFTFSEDTGTSFVLSDITVTGGTLGPLSGSGLVRTAVFTAGSTAGVAPISVADGSYVDASGNPGLGDSLVLQVLDVTAPTLEISSEMSQIGTGATTTITFTFSEDTGTSFVLSDITVTGGTLGPLSGSGLVRTAVFTAGSTAGVAPISVADGSYVDASGNPGLGDSLELKINAPMIPQGLKFDTDIGPPFISISNSGKTVQSGPDIIPAYNGIWFSARIPTPRTAQEFCYFEIEVNQFTFIDSRELAIGIAPAGTSASYFEAGSKGMFQYFGSGEVRFSEQYSLYGSQFGIGDVVGCSIYPSGANVNVNFYKNGEDQGGSIISLSASEPLVPFVSFIHNSTSTTTTTKQLTLGDYLNNLPSGFNPW